MAVRTAVIPAAGMGTRFVPATRAVPKELLPVYDTPALQLVANEAAAAGCERLVIVSSRSKPAIEMYAERMSRPGLEVRLVYQPEPRGLGHAVGCAREHLGNESFAVLLPDEVMGDSSLLRAMVEEHERSGEHVVGLVRVRAAEVSAYGCAATRGVPDERGVVGVRDVVEKPAAAEAPSDLILAGRYVLGPEAFARIDALQPAHAGELQLSDALAALARAGRLRGVVAGCRRHDTGTPLGLLRAALDAALARSDAGPPLRAWLGERLSR